MFKKDCKKSLFHNYKIDYSFVASINDSYGNISNDKSYVEKLFSDSLKAYDEDDKIQKEQSLFQEYEEFRRNFRKQIYQYDIQNQFSQSCHAVSVHPDIGQPSVFQYTLFPEDGKSAVMLWDPIHGFRSIFV